MTDTLFLGYGNPDRQDDGVAWHVLCGLASQLGMQPPATWEDEFPQAAGQPFVFQFELQLTPEMAEDIRDFARVFFVDAHTGAVPVEVHLRPISAAYQTSPFTHHLTPEMLLSMCLSLYGKAPKAWLLSVRGYEFGFDTTLSAKTANLVPLAVKKTLIGL